MTDKQKYDEIKALLDFLQLHIKNSVDLSFTDLTFNLEEVIMNVLNVFEKHNERYENINNLHHNYPAIDLVNKSKQIAIQVTTNANATKAKKTIDTYKKHNLQYKELVIIGFITASKSAFQGATIHGIKYLLSKIKHANSAQKDEIFEILKRQIPVNILNPLTDKMCYSVTFDVIDRSAIRDNDGSEGNYEDMVFGLEEIKQIITVGKVKDKDIRAKSMYEYAHPVKIKLQEIEFKVSEIISVCNANRKKHQHGFLILNQVETQKIDQLKTEIIGLANKLAAQLNLGKTMIANNR